MGIKKDSILREWHVWCTLSEGDTFPVSALRGCVPGRLGEAARPSLEMVVL